MTAAISSASGELTAVRTPLQPRTVGAATPSNWGPTPKPSPSPGPVPARFSPNGDSMS